MSAINEEELLITFDELLQLENADISTCVSKYSALNICENCSAPPRKIYNLWVQKLFKAYDLDEFTTKDWQNVIEYLSNVLREFVKNLNASDDTLCQEVEQWWLDTQDMLKWMESIASTLEVSVLSLILNFVLDIIIRTCKFADKKNFKIVCNLQQFIVKLTNNFLSKMPIKDDDDFEGFNKTASSLCEVGSVISSVDIKTSIETWRTVAKLSEKLYNYNKKFVFAETETSTSTERQWNEKAILAIFKELNKILRFYNQNPCSSNDNLLQIAQFYLKILRLIINYSKETINTFPAMKEFIEVYTFCQHEMESNENPKIESLVNKPLYDIFSLIYKENSMAEVVLQHFKYDVDNFKSCKLVFDYFKIYIENCLTNRLNGKIDLETVLKVYNCLVEGPLIFIDKDKYTQLLENFGILTILDSTNKIHKKLCENVIDSPWIRAYTSMEILTIHYSYILNSQKCDIHNKCLEFWVSIWNKFNKSNDTYRRHKKLIEILLKNILNNTSDAKLQQCTLNKLENIEIILLLCDKETEQNLQYLRTHLVENLKKMQERCINVVQYNELLNLLEICISKPQLINDFLKENLLVTLTGLLILPASEVQKFQEFINNCLQFFYLQPNQEKNQKLLKFLMDHEHQCYNIQSVFLVEFLLNQRPQSCKLLQALNTTYKLTSTISNLIDCTPVNNQPIDMKIFKNLPHTFLQSSNQNHDLEQVKKKPRLDQGNFSNIKFILNDLNINTQKLSNFPRSTFNNNDFDIMRKIKNTIEKLLTN